MCHAIQTPGGWYLHTPDGKHLFNADEPTEFPTVLAAVEALRLARQEFGPVPPFKIVPVYTVVPKMRKD
jgi:hypothetical protein